MMPRTGTASGVAWPRLTHRPWGVSALDIQALASWLARCRLASHHDINQTASQYRRHLRKPARSGYPQPIPIPPPFPRVLMKMKKSGMLKQGAAPLPFLSASRSRNSSTLCHAFAFITSQGEARATLSFTVAKPNCASLVFCSWAHRSCCAHLAAGASWLRSSAASGLVSALPVVGAACGGSAGAAPCCVSFFSSPFKYFSSPFCL